MWSEPLSRRGRTLSTAREVLRVLRFLQTHPEGVKPRTVAAYLGKSPHTAYYLLNTLCQEGFALKRRDGRYYPTSGAWDSPATSGAWDSPASESLREIAVELNRASGCRSYLVALEGQEIFLKGIFGHQGQPGPKGLGARITRASHALAVGKAVLSLLGEGALDLLPEDLPTFTPKTLTRETLLNELERVRRDGLALDLEEYQEGLCCLAVPVRVQGQIAAVGLAVTKGRFLAQGDKLAELLCRFVPKEV